jgi:hypothetical protein
MKFQVIFTEYLVMFIKVRVGQLFGKEILANIYGIFVNVYQGEGGPAFWIGNFRYIFRNILPLLDRKCWVNFP